jgi:ferritin
VISQKMQSALNDQINAELGSAYAYLSMAAYFEGTNLTGSARWMRRQAQEEMSHAMKIFDFVHSRDGRVTLAAIAQPPVEFASPLAVWEQVLKQEQDVTARIHKLYALASAEKDYATQVMLQWFIDEQVEEEKTAKSILEQVKMVGSGTALFFVDRHLGKDAEPEGS